MMRAAHSHSTTTMTPKDVVFRHVLPASRLGKSHDSLEDFRDAIAPFVSIKSKHYTLVLIVTEPHVERILLGFKQRGFGKNMYNSFGGKVEDGEDLDECASRELLEETGIAVSQEHMATCHVGELRFSFDDSDTEMVVHVFRVNVSTSNEKEGMIYVDPSDIRPCEEIVPEWFDSYQEIPFENMFADDSLWLTQLLSFPANKRIWMEGHFHFEPGGQEVNTIRHYHLTFEKRSLEQQLFHQLHIHRVHNPSIKEFKEAYAFAKAVQSSFRKSKFDIVMDVAGGHGALAALLLIMLPSVQEAIVIDPADVGNKSVQRAWGSFYSGKILRYLHECLRTGLPEELERYQNLNVLVVACHACQHLSEEVLEISCTFGASAAVMPCCQRDTSPGCSWKNTSKNLGIPIAKTMDILLAGRVMGLRNSSNETAYDVRIKTIDEKITPQNRIIMCRKLDEDVTVDMSNDVAHEKLERAYRKAHEIRSSRSRRQHDSMKDKVCVTSLFVGIAVGVALSITLLGRHR